MFLGQNSEEVILDDAIKFRIVTAYREQQETVVVKAPDTWEDEYENLEDYPKSALYGDRKPGKSLLRRMAD